MDLDKYKSFFSIKSEATAKEGSSELERCQYVIFFIISFRQLVSFTSRLHRARQQKEEKLIQYFYIGLRWKKEENGISSCLLLAASSCQSLLSSRVYMRKDLPPQNEFSGHDNSIQNIIPLLKKGKM